MSDQRHDLYRKYQDQDREISGLLGKCGPMKIAVGIIGITLGLIALMQSCTITGLSGIVEDEVTGEAGAMGMITALLMFFGGAFSFGVPRAAQVFFGLAFLVSIPARDNFADMWVWGIISAILAGLLFFHKKPKESDTSQAK